MNDYSTHSGNRAISLLGTEKIIFLNAKNCQKTEDIIRDNLCEIRKQLKRLHIDFIFVPELNIQTESLSPEFRNYLNYNYPFIENELLKLYGIEPSEQCKFIAKTLGIKDAELPCLVFIDSEKKKHILRIDEDFLSGSIPKLVHDYLENLRVKRFDNVVMFRTGSVDRTEKEQKEDDFNEQIEKISDEVISKIKELDIPDAFKFFMEIMNQRIIKESGKRAISRLYIDSEYQIYLPDYNNIRIELTPLQKTVYFLFLNHPEGIFCSDFHDYHDEILKIYTELSKRNSWFDVVYSVADLSKAYSSSMSEKISKIRNEFLRHIDLHLAKNYFIWGERRERKKILLDRQLVVFDKKPAFIKCKTM
ncbi:MAG TPA: hypothetical protein PK784_05625 [Tenuifilaceae bacterium]|nr:hypothetical protein [Tenuifilaceae bacterium]HPN21725.1 hypothetical protein [Tenuifilaceae bacterium]